MTNEGNWLTRELTKENLSLMLVAVKTEALVNTPWNAALVPCSASCVLNREETLSAAGEKTCFNFSKGRRIRLAAPTLVDTHYWPTCAREALC